MRKVSMPRSAGVLALFALAAVITLAAPLSAHHGWGGYHTEEFEVSGTLETPVSTSGPHATTKVRTTDGKVWDVVLAPGGRTVSAGLKEGVIPVGSTVTVHGHRHRDPNKLEIKTERLSWNNRTFNVYPDRD
jgi:hypothetical protein